MVNAESFIKNADIKIELLKKKRITILYEISLSFGNKPNPELRAIEKYYRDLNYSIETKICKSRLVDIIIGW